MDVVDLVDVDDAADGGSGGCALAKPLSAGEAENIAVCIRVRPLNEREVRSRDCNVLRTLDALNVISVTDVDGAPLGGKHNVFQYDHIFDETRSTRHMYRRVAQRIVRSTLEGINGTIFAYGQTSSGKTFTMQGGSASGSASGDASVAAIPSSEADAGILQLAVEDIFSYIERCDDRDFLLRVSFVEIYNEVVRDLLVAGDRGSNLKVREDPRKGVYVECKEEIITSYGDILALLAAGNERRAVGQTAMNDRSSRSHSIFRIVVESKQRSGARRQSEDDGSGAVLVACLSLVDLAGSESVRHTAAEGIRQREAGNINKSLLTLSRVINALASASGAGAQSAPFRDSKLTRLLQNSLDGNTRTLIVCCVTPSDRFLDETKSTLQFAARAKHLQTSASVNEVLDDQAQLRRLQREVRELKKLARSDAFSQLQAENEALMHDQRRHKDEYARLMGLILTSATRAAPPSDRKRPHKRSRETWCPGDFPARGRDLERGPPPSPSAQPRKRRAGSDAKENVMPQNLLRAMDAEADDSVDAVDDEVEDQEQELAGDRAHVLTASLLGVLELALQNFRDDCDASHDTLDDALAQVHALVASEEDRERLAELLQDLRTLADLTANAEHLRGENELLNMEVEELHRKLGLLSDASAPSSQEAGSSSSADAAAAQRQQVAEAEALVEQLAALRVERDESRAETQQLERALASAADEAAQHAAEHAGLADAVAALEEQLQQTAKCHAALEAQVTSLVQEKSALAETLEALERERASQETEAEAAGLAAELQTLLQDVAALQLGLEAATTENRALGAERDAAKQELEATRAQQQSAADAAQQALETLRAAASEEAERLRMALEFAVNETQASALNIQDLSAERAQLTEALRAIKDEMDGVLAKSVDKADRLEAEVESLRAERKRESERLRAELEAAGDAAAKADEEKRALLAAVAELEATLGASTSQVAALRVENERLQEAAPSADVTAMHEEQTRLALLVEELETRLTGRLDASAEIAEYEATVAAQGTAIEQLRAELALSDDEHAALRARIDELADAEVKATASEEAPQEAQGAGGGDRLAALGEANAKVSAELETVAAQRRELLEELSALESQLMDESKEKQRLRAAVDALEKQLQASDAPSELADELARAKQAEAVLLNELETLSGAMEKLEAEHQRLQARHPGGDDDGGDDADALRQRLALEAELRATLELDVASYEDALQVVRGELTASGASIADLLEKLQAMEAELAALNLAKDAAERDANATRALTQRAKEEQDELRFQNQQRALAFEAQEAAAAEALERLQQQLQDAHETIRSQQEALATASPAEQFEQTIGDLQHELLEARKALAVQADEWRAKQADAEQQVARLTGDAAEHRQAMEHQLAALDAQWRAKEQALSQQVAAELSAAAAHKAALEAELRASDAQWRAKEQALSQQAAAELDSLREQYQAAQEELDAYQKYADDEIHKLRAAVEAGDVEAAIARAREDEAGGRLEREAAELRAERAALEQKLETLLSSRDDAVDHLQREVAELKAASEQLESEAYRHRHELEDLAEALKSAQLEATHYRQQLAAAQDGHAELEALVETQRRRVDKLEKVKMTTETLELFRRLKADRAELQAKAAALERELEGLASATQQATRQLERKEEELAAACEHVAELQAESEAARDAEAQLREQLEQLVAKDQSENVMFLEKENLELLVENRRLKKRLESGDVSVSSRLLADAPEFDPSAAAAAAILAEAPDTRRFLLSAKDGEEKDEEEEGDGGGSARPACAQQ